ncbi:MAG TPA: hypothetical protein VFZ00_20485 [Solirubrobacter sp.]|nr:hypothetical protein [Solirubrobacter sp.]
MTPETQRQEALARANEVRIKNSVWKTENTALSSAEGLQRLIDVLTDPREPHDRLQIGQALLSVRRLGVTKAAPILKHASVLSGDRKIGELTFRQRQVIVHDLTMLRRRWLDK